MENRGEVAERREDRGADLVQSKSVLTARQEGGKGARGCSPCLRPHSLTPGYGTMMVVVVKKQLRPLITFWVEEGDTKSTVDIARRRGQRKVRRGARCEMR